MHHEPSAGLAIKASRLVRATGLGLDVVSSANATFSVLLMYFTHRSACDTRTALEESQNTLTTLFEKVEQGERLIKVKRFFQLK